MFSIVIPLYNKQESIIHTLQCVLDQVFDKYEVLVVDDGSTDSSVAHVKDFLSIDSRINLLHKENGGVSSARNEGIRHAKYEYIAFLDADDFWEPTYLEEQAKMIIDFPEASMWGLSWYNIIDNQKIPQTHNISPDFRGFIPEYWEHELQVFWTGAIVIRKTVFQRIGYFDERIHFGEDLDMWYRIVLNYSVAFYNMPLTNYFLDAENRAMRKEIALNEHLPYFIEKFAEYRKTNKEFRRYFDRQCLYRLYPYVHNKDLKTEIDRIVGQIDFSELTLSYRLRFMFPRIYDLYLNLKNSR